MIRQFVRVMAQKPKINGFLLLLPLAFRSLQNHKFYVINRQCIWSFSLFLQKQGMTTLFKLQLSLVICQVSIRNIIISHIFLGPVYVGMGDRREVR